MSRDWVRSGTKDTVHGTGEEVWEPARCAGQASAGQSVAYSRLTTFRANCQTA
jgi:hypothetical protein